MDLTNATLQVFSDLQDECLTDGEVNIDGLADVLFGHEADLQQDNDYEETERKFDALMQDMYKTDLELRSFETAMDREAAKITRATKRKRVAVDEEDEQEEANFEVVRRHTKRKLPRNNIELFRVLMHLLHLSIKARPTHKSEACKLVFDVLGRIDLPSVPSPEFSELLRGDCCMEVFMSVLMKNPFDVQTGSGITANYHVLFGSPYVAGGNEFHLKTFTGLSSKNVQVFEELLEHEQVVKDARLSEWYKKLLAVVKYCFNLHSSSNRKRAYALRTSTAGKS